MYNRVPAALVHAKWMGEGTCKRAASKAQGAGGDRDRGADDLQVLGSCQSVLQLADERQQAGGAAGPVHSVCEGAQAAQQPVRPVSLANQVLACK